MNNLIAFFLGILLCIILLVSFWYAGILNTKIKSAYKNSVCYNICPTT
jgi:uncharacterized membrane protein